MTTGATTQTILSVGLPQGPMYYELRTQVLATFVPGARTTLGSSLTLSDWLTGGSYVVVSATKKEFVLRVATIDLASALLTDVEHLTNHCFEHLQEMVSFHNEVRVRSDAWAVVTTYYFAFFCAQSFLRLLGTPITFLTKQKIEDIKMLGGVQQAPGAGAYSIEKIADVSASHAEYRLKRVDAKVHEATWKRALMSLKALVSNPALGGNASEVRFYSELTATSLFGTYSSGYDWPSEIRSKANYPPGFAYKRVQLQDVTKVKRAIGRWKPVGSWSDIENLLSTSVADCSAGKVSAFHAHVSMMHDVAQCLFLLSRELYSELLNRGGIDRRWERHRLKFRETMDLNVTDFCYLAKTY